MPTPRGFDLADPHRFQSTPRGGFRQTGSPDPAGTERRDTVKTIFESVDRLQIDPFPFAYGRQVQELKATRRSVTGSTHGRRPPPDCGRDPPRACA